MSIVTKTIPPNKLQDILATLDMLTSDDDIRQQTILIILETGCDDVHTIYKEICISNAVVKKIAENSQYFILNSAHIADMLSNFHPSEADIIALMMIGCTNAQIVEYRGISMVRLNQLISCISKHPFLESICGTKETSNRRREI
jgi:hypothetical protein